MDPHSSSDETPQEKQKPLQSNCIVSSLHFHAPPLFHLCRQHPKPNPRLLKSAEDPLRAARQFHSSVVSAAHNCLKSLHLLLSQNPFFNNLLSFSSHLQAFRQVECKAWRNVSAVSSSSHNFAAILPGDSVAGVVVTNGVLNFLNIYNSILVVRLVLTWFPNAPPAIVTPLSTLCDPYLNIFRGIIPPLGGTLDLSPILAFLLLNTFTSAAAALPAELPPKKAVSPDDPTTHTVEHHRTTSQEKWMRRLAGSKK